MLNRPTDVPVADALPPWAASPPSRRRCTSAARSRSGSGWCLGRARDPEGLDGFVPVLGDLGLVDLDLDPDDVSERFCAIRLYAGYSGWGPGQLERELAEDAWFVVDAEPDDPFLPDGAALWQRILARQGGPLARLALFPSDPSLN